MARAAKAQATSTRRLAWVLPHRTLLWRALSLFSPRLDFHRRWCFVLQQHVCRRPVFRRFYMSALWLFVFHSALSAFVARSVLTRLRALRATHFRGYMT